MQCGLCEAQKETYRLIDENKEAFSVIHIEPLKLGHLMILPKRHVIDIIDLSEKELKSFFQLTDKLKDKIKKLSNQDLIIQINTGKHKTQEHFHAHILPAQSGLRDIIASLEGVPKRQLLSKEKLEEMKNKILKSFIP